jgi:tryptophan 2,3-dioxygenase
MKNEPMSYEKYLQLDTLLSAQKPLSQALGRPAHEEMLFISIHQTYEIWFKQVIFELDSILAIFGENKIDERNMEVIVSRLVRINLIFRVLVQQVEILETMTPMDFLEFRDLIFAASGFQSYQFRLIENKLGLRPGDRLAFHAKPYHVELAPDKAATVRLAEDAPSLFVGLEAWLARTPFLKSKDFHFWEEYKVATNIMFQHDEQFIASNENLSAAEKTKLIENINTSKKMFVSLFDPADYEARRQKQEWRLSYDAIHAALLIQLYREQPIFQLPFRLITEILNLDSLLTQWRYRHSIMVKRMLGQRIGTGGSSGEDYLRRATEQHKIFEDFYKLTTFFIPRSRRPELPPSFAKKLDFNYVSN